MREEGGQLKLTAAPQVCAIKYLQKYFCKTFFFFAKLFSKMVVLCSRVCCVLLKFSFTCVLRLMLKIVSLGREVSISA